MMQTYQVRFGCVVVQKALKLEQMLMMQTYQVRFGCVVVGFELSANVMQR
jgi:hypothetical protein